MSMFAHLGVYPKLLVTGPARSGTTITGQMIAEDTGHQYVDEAAFGGVDTETWRRLLDRSNRVVVQCPAMLRAIISNPPKGVFVVFMRRNVHDILRSAIRIRAMSSSDAPPPVLGDICAEYECWDGSTKDFPYADVPYESIRSHRLYVPDHERVAFGIKQTAPNIQRAAYMVWSVSRPSNRPRAQ